jgi:hypothetical protein
MADDPNTNFKTGDDEYNIWRKILARLNLGISTSGGGGGGGGGAVTIADGADVALGTKADAKATDTTSAWTVISLLKGILGNGGGGGGGGAVTVADGADVTQGAKADAAATDSTSAWTVVSVLKGIFAKLAGTLTTSVSNFPATQPVSGTVAVSSIGAGAAVIGHVIADSGSTTAVTALPAIPAGTNVIGHVIADSGSTTAVTGNVAVTNAGLTNLDVALSTRLKPADTLAAVTTVTTVAALTSGNVGGFTTAIKDAAAVTAGAYVAGNAVGAKRTLTNAVRVSGGTGIIDSVVLLDRANQKAAMELIIFDSDPTNATITDHAAFVFGTDDLKVVARISIGAADYVTLNSKALVCLRGLAIAVKAVGSTSLFAVLVTTGTPTFAATTDVQLTVGILQD